MYFSKLNLVISPYAVVTAPQTSIINLGTILACASVVPKMIFCKKKNRLGTRLKLPYMLMVRHMTYRGILSLFLHVSISSNRTNHASKVAMLLLIALSQNKNHRSKGSSPSVL